MSGKHRCLAGLRGLGEWVQLLQVRKGERALVLRPTVVLIVRVAAALLGHLGLWHLDRPNHASPVHVRVDQQLALHAPRVGDHDLPLVVPIRVPAVFRLFTFLLDKNGQLNYNIDITELIHTSAGSDHLVAARRQSPVGVSSEPSPSGRHKGGLPEDLRQVL